MQIYRKGEIHPIKKWVAHDWLDGWSRPWTHQKTGYAYVSQRMGIKRLEHRAVMEAVLGRDLYPHENVHHLNGVRNDNRPDNLELWSTMQPKGQRIPDKLKFAWEMITLYDPDHSFTS